MKHTPLVTVGDVMRSVAALGPAQQVELYDALSKYLQGHNLI